MKKVLVANRGEIALRIVRACRDAGLVSVAVYADGDVDAPFARLADEAYGLGGDTAGDTYLDGGKIVEIARRAGADAVHPGYGFLSENAGFARAVVEAGLIWIGPDPQVIDALGDKVEARRIAARVGAPLVPGSDGPVSGADEILAFARAHGLPVAIKAAFGGGGRGLKVARRMDEIEELYSSAVREAKAAFGRGECFVERFIDRPRHVEAQVLADRHGRVAVLGTRDCSLQRRNQKLVEEAPAPFLDEALRARIHEAAGRICAEAGYTGAGTVEFLLGEDGILSFLEVNTRLQVEHPVTEETTGIDLVAEQLRIAQGLPLSFDAVPAPRGHSIEFRINAEDPGRGFLPVAGRLTRFEPPSGPGVRVDAGVGPGSRVHPAFDSLLAKLIVTGATRQQAIARARRALEEFAIEGVSTVLPFHRAVLESPEFSDEGFSVHTRWIETDFADRLEAAARPVEPAAQAMIRTFVEIDGRRHALALPASLAAGFAAGTEPADARSAADTPTQEGTLAAPVSGILRSWRVADGEHVEAGSVVAMMEAMKMETPVAAPRAGRLVHAAEEGSDQEAGAAIGRIEV